MLAQLIGVEDDEGGLAVLSVNGVEINAMDCLGYGNSSAPYPKVGDMFSPEFSCLFDDDASWNSVFQGNPNNEQRLESTGLWSYRALGRLVAIDSSGTQATADCGCCLLPLPIEISSSDYLGMFVGFDVKRLSVWRA